MPQDIRHIVVYTLENHSFDQILGEFPGADGLLDAHSSGLSVSPFPIGSCSLAQWANPNHSWRAIHEECNDGRMNGFVDVDGIDTMGYYPFSRFPKFMDLAQSGRVLDQYFCSVLGPTLPNRLYLVAGHSAGLKNDPRLFSPWQVDTPTLFDQLQEAGVNWRYYIGNYGAPLIGRILAKQLLFCPLLWIERFHHPPLGPHLYPLSQFAEDVHSHALPAVSYLAPGIWQSGHPPLPLSSALDSAMEIHRLLKSSDLWPHTVLIINFDEAGGFYDHVAPPRIDLYGPGLRVPAIVLSPHLSPGIVHHPFDHTSVLRFIEEQFELPLLGERTTKMNSLALALADKLS